MGADYAHVRGECPGGFHLMRVKVDTMYQLTAKRVFLCVIPAFLPPLLLSLAPPLVLLCRQTMRVLNVNKNLIYTKMAQSPRFAYFPNCFAHSRNLDRCNPEVHETWIRKRSGEAHYVQLLTATIDSTHVDCQCFVFPVILSGKWLFIQRFHYESNKKVGLFCCVYFVCGGLGGKLCRNSWKQFTW